VALDTETDGFLAYRPSVCLIQLGTPDQVALVDPLADVDLQPLRATMASPETEWVVHDGEQDVSYLRRGLQLEPARIFDTFVAARIAGVREVGLASLVLATVGVTLDKGEQRSDWRARPLRRTQLEYAADDVRYLLAVRDALEAKVAALGRTEQAAQEFERVRRRQLPERVADLEGWRSLPEAKGLNPGQLGVLRALFETRERLAEARNTAAFTVVPNRGLARLAQVGPADAASVHRALKAVGARVADEDVGTLLAAMRDAPPQPGPLHPRHPAESPEERLATARFQQLKTWRAKVAAEMDVEPPVVAPNALLHALAHQVPAALEDLARVEDMLPWRVQALGPGLLAELALPPPATSRHQGRKGR
jgi:ribonuclease D